MAGAHFDVEGGLDRAELQVHALVDGDVAHDVHVVQRQRALQVEVLDGHRNAHLARAARGQLVQHALKHLFAYGLGRVAVLVRLQLGPRSKQGAQAGTGTSVLRAMLQRHIAAPWTDGSWFRRCADDPAPSKPSIGSRD